MQLVSEDLRYERRPQAFYIVGSGSEQNRSGAEALESFEKATQLTPRFAAALFGGRRDIFCAAKAANGQACAGSICFLAPPTAKSLWLAVRLKHSFGNRDGSLKSGFEVKEFISVFQRKSGIPKVVKAIGERLVFSETPIIRRKSRQIMVGNVPVGGDAPISVQSMTNTSTADVAATVEQIKAYSGRGADIVRVSVPSLEEAEAFGQIRQVGGCSPGGRHSL